VPVYCVKTDEMRDVDALLFGRTRYDLFASSWPSRSGVLADRMNGVRKYVISTTREDLAWHKSQPITGDVGEAVSAAQALARPGHFSSSAAHP
jgi:dihydrofolate reductase